MVSLKKENKTRPAPSLPESGSPEDKRAVSRHSGARLFAGQLTDAVTLFLFAAAAVSALTGGYTRALPVMVTALVNTAAGFVGEYRSEKAVARISETAGEDISPARQPTPLSMETKKLGRILTVSSIVGAAVYLALSLLRGGSLWDSCCTSLCLMIAALPVGVRSLYTIACSLAVGRCLDKGAAVCSYPAFQRMREVGTICIGKSGILTDGYSSAAALTVFSGSGFKEYRYSETEGRLTSGGSMDGYRAWEDSALSRILICAAVCSSAKRVTAAPESGSRNRGRRTYYKGDPREAAMLRLCSSCGIERELLLCEKLSEKPFAPDDGYMLVTVREQGGRIVSYAKGAPEIISALCSVSEGTLSGVEMLCDRYGSRGMHLLAYGMNSGSGWQLLGLAAFRETLRPHTAERVRNLRRMGINTLLLTGDHPAAARAAAMSAGVVKPDSLTITGDDLDLINDEQLYDRVRSIALGSRMVSRKSERIVSTLKSRGVVCASAAEQPVETADIKISAVRGGDILLTEGGMTAVAALVSESRGLFSHMLRALCCLISSGTGMLLTLILSAAMGMPQLLDGSHLLVAGLLCGCLPALLLVSAPAAEGEHETCPQGSPPLDRSALADAAGRGVLNALCVLGCSSLLLSRGYHPDAVSSAALLAMTLSGALFFAEKAENSGKNFIICGILTPASVIATLYFWAPMREMFRICYPGGKALALAILMPLSVPFVKKLRYYVKKRFRRDI